jgi:membrane protease YdiL (CAAX protease family)
MTSKFYLKRFQLPLFFVLSLASWVIWIPQAGVALGISESAISLDSPLNALTVWGPALAAILVTLLTVGRAGVRALFHPIGRWRAAPQWFIFVLFFAGARWLAAHLIDLLLGHSYELGSGPIFSLFGPEQAIMLPFAVILAFPNTLGEELGWRGFALPGLQARYNALVSSIILGLFWGFWHIPTWIGQGFVDLSWLSLLVRVLSLVPIAILFTWVYNNTNGSLFMAWLFHASLTITGYFVPLLPTSTETVLSWIVALVVVVVTGPARFRRPVR